MATVKGNILFVSSRAAHVSEVWVRAKRVRPTTGGVVTTGNDRFPVESGGQVTLTVLEGPAVLSLISQGRPVDTIPILVGSKSSYSLEDVVSAAELTDTSTQRELERLAADIKSLMESSAADRRAAASSASAAKSSASAAKTSETNAADSAKKAADSASSASWSSSNASTAEKNARAASTRAKNDADRAKTSESNAASSASAAKTSENAAKSHADRAGKIAESTSWSGDKLTVNGKTSPSLTGPKGDRGPKGQDGEVKFESLTQAQKETLRGPAGVVVSTTEPVDKNLVWVDPSGANLELLSNGFFVMTDAEATALSGKVPKGTYVVAVQSGNVYREE